jgi:hypothetical protein
VPAAPPPATSPCGNSSSVVGMRARSCAVSVLPARLRLAVERARVRAPVLLCAPPAPRPRGLSASACFCALGPPCESYASCRARCPPWAPPAPGPRFSLRPASLQNQPHVRTCGYIPRRAALCQQPATSAPVSIPCRSYHDPTQIRLFQVRNTFDIMNNTT